MTKTIKRRSFLKTAGVGLAASTIAAPAIAQSMPELKWRMTTSWPKSLDTLYGGAEYIAKRVGEMTDGKFQIRAFAGGEIVPALQALDATSNNTVEMCHTASYYYVGKDPTFAFNTAMPHGLNTRQQMAWLSHGGGSQVLQEFYDGYNVHQIAGGETGAQMGGWYRKEIKSVEDLKGLKMRIGGWGGQVFSRVGVVPQLIAGGDIYPSLEKGTIDAAEWVGPYDDEKLGFYKVAKYYYYPGWWEGCAMLSVFINKGAWEKLPKGYQAVVEAACAEGHLWMLAKYDAENPAAMRRLVAGGAVLKPFPKSVMEATYKAAYDLYDETAKKNAKFKKVYDQWKHFRDEERLWFRVAEETFDNFVFPRK